MAREVSAAAVKAAAAVERVLEGVAGEVAASAAKAAAAV